MSSEPTVTAADKASSMTALASKAGPEESLKNFHLLEALRGGDAAVITPLLVSLAADESKGTTTDVGAPSTPLHLAVRCAKYPTIELVLRHLPSSLNSLDTRGQTPLHIAASLGRTDVVALLLNQPKIDDMIKDSNGRTCREVGGAEVAGLISASRAHYNEAYLRLLATYASSPILAAPATPTPASPASPGAVISAASGHVSNTAAEKLYHVIAEPRAQCIDFGAKDSATGSTILHEAAKRKEFGIIKLVIAKGGDVLAKDKKAKIALDVAKDERIKQVLRQTAATEELALQTASDTHASKSTQQAPAPMRGYIAKWTNMARGYRTRWMVLDQGILSYYRSQEDEGKASRGAISMSVARIAPPGADKLKFEVCNKLGKSFPSFWLRGSHPVESMRWVEALRLHIEYAGDGSAISRIGTNNSSYAPSIASTVDDRHSRRHSENNFDGMVSPSPSQRYGDRDGSIIGDDETFIGEDGTVPRADDFSLLGNSTKTQLDLTIHLLESLVVPATQEGAPSTATDVKEALRGSLVSLGGMLDEYVDVVAQRERYFVRRYEREIEAKRLWEENMKELAAQHEAMEVELSKVARDNVRRKRALQDVRANLATSSPLVSPQNSLDLARVDDGSVVLPPASSVTGGVNPRLSTLSTLTATSRARALSSPTRGRLRAGTMHTLNPTELEEIVDSALIGEADEDSDEEFEEEFFEAVESGALPLTPTSSTLVERAEPAKKFLDSMDLEPYKGYENLRTKLPIDNDTRPPASLWAILKGSIGKDLSRISFPISWNEPLSFLSRMAEDLEFAECLDSAAADQDSTKRIAFVAAYAMSNYSSTIGRIAKPFNPMLGETFEYVDLKKKYRYVSEQVLHHPPISACIAESPSWEYYGEIDAKSKFLGKSFEIRPVGVAHVKLRLPVEWAPDYPATGRSGGMVEEHYSWTKVTTSISNFIFGSPIIDHIGDMVITNHRTGDVCTLTFKPRGWRGSGASEIKGKVVDKAGKEHWDIAGKWSSQLVARRVGAGSGDLAPDASVPTTQAGEVAPEYIRLWKNSVKPVGVPFNLTTFAVGLNDDNPALKVWLPPTDSRLRPDQHSFENGDYDKANELKFVLEDHQRATRRKRENGELPAHKSRWFSRAQDADTGEGYWEPARKDGDVEYWEERLRVGKLKQEGEKAEWKGVDPIFADY